MAIIFAFYCFHAIGQKEDSTILDSLLNELNIVTTDTGEVYILCELTSYYNSVNTEKSIQYGNQALELAGQIDYKKGIVDALYRLGVTYEFKGKYDEALRVILKMKEIAERHNYIEYIGTAYTEIGHIYKYQEKYDKAIEFYKQSQILAEQNFDTLGYTINKGNIGSIYKSQGKYNDALVIYSEMIPVLEQFQRFDILSGVYLNIGNATYAKDENYNKAMQFYNQAYITAIKSNSFYQASLAKYNIGDILLSEENYYEAIGNLEKSLEIATKGQISKIMLICTESLSEAYAIIGNYKKAYEFHKQHLDIKEMLISEESMRSLNEMQTKYETEQKEKEIELLNKEKEKQTALSLAETKRKNIIIFSSIGGLLLVTIFSVFLFNRFRVTNQQKLIIEEKQKEITDSITYAKRLQTAILPPESYWKSYLPNSFVLYQPKDIVSGDFFWLECVNDLILFSAADCTGHGVSGAMVSVVCSNALNRTVKEFGVTEPDKILNKVRELVLNTFAKSESDIKDGMDISLCCLNTKTNELIWSGANNPLWYIRENNLFEIKGDKQPIGKNDNPEPFTLHTIQLQKQDTIYIFTDGYADQFGGEKNKKFMYKPLKNLLVEIHQQPLATQKEHLQRYFTNWKGNTEQTDDVLVIGVKI